MCIIGAGTTLTMSHSNIVAVESGVVTDVISIGSPLSMSRSIISCPIKLASTGTVFRDKQKSGVIDHEEFDCELEMDLAAYKFIDTQMRAAKPDLAANRLITITMGEQTATGDPATLIGTGDISGLSIGDMENETVMTATMTLFWDGETDPAWTDETNA